ncbi:MAG: hypothetical protein NVSMB10_06660 [Steroidobacteraceae bacterium]
MRLIKPDHARTLALAGVPGPVRRPVDIDQSQTGHTALRTLRIYRFDAGSVIDGHAEEDEVFIVVLAGSAELSMSSERWPGSRSQFALVAAGSADAPCAAYLPPHAAYRLIPRGDAEVAYARATPVSGRPPEVFTVRPRVNAAGSTVLLDAGAYAQRLRLRLLRIDAQAAAVAVPLVPPSAAMCEALVHLRTVPTRGAATIMAPGAAATSLDSWDTVAVAPGESLRLHVAAGSSALAVMTMAV